MARNATIDDLGLLRELAEKGVPCIEVQRQYGICRKSVATLLQKHEIEIKRVSKAKRPYVPVPNHLRKRRKPFTPDRTEIEVYIERGLSQTEIGRLYNVPKTLVQRFCKLHNLPTKRMIETRGGFSPKKLEKEKLDIEQIREMIEKPMGFTEIRKALGIPRGTLQAFFLRHGLKAKTHKDGLPSYNETDLTGQKFTRLTVLKYTKTIKRRKYYLCLCDCGTEKEIASNKLRCGTTKSCGCYGHEKRIQASHDRKGKYLSSIPVTRHHWGRKDDSQTRRVLKRNPQYRWYFIKEGERIRCRSSYEVILANYFMRKGIVFDFEPPPLQATATNKYHPDFYVPSENRYYETKGFFEEDDQQLKKINLLKDAYDIRILFEQDLRIFAELPYSIGRCRQLANKSELSMEDYFAQGLYY